MVIKRDASIIGKDQDNKFELFLHRFTSQFTIQYPLQVNGSESHKKSDLDLAWVEKIDPNKALFKGKAYLRAKRILDVGLVVIAMPVLLPLLLLIALLIKLESPRGSIFFVQHRTGINGNLFKMFKFRTMVPNAEELMEKLIHLNELEWPDFKITNDPRITRIGRILRKTSLDELPQFFNVLIGNMSLVGPRPTIFTPEEYTLWHTERLEVKQGITGLWQLYGRAETLLDDRMRLDLSYIEHRSLWFDIQILIRTVKVVLKQQGAK